jgi:septal ring factor EnvC (AmiA/AmiB activator)
MNADELIKAAETHSMKYNADQADRLAYEVGALRAYIRDVCDILENTQAEVKQLQAELMWERKHGH